MQWGDTPPVSKRGEIVRRIIDEFAERRSDTALAVYDEHVVWDSSRFAFPDIQGVFFGREGLAEFWRRWLEPWERMDFELVELREVDNVVLAAFTQENLAKLSGVPTRFGHVLAWTFRGRAIVRVDQFPTMEAALAELAFDEGD